MTPLDVVLCFLEAQPWVALAQLPNGLNLLPSLSQLQYEVQFPLQTSALSEVPTWLELPRHRKGQTNKCRDGKDMPRIHMLAPMLPTVSTIERSCPCGLTSELSGA